MKAENVVKSWYLGIHFPISETTFGICDACGEKLKPPEEEAKVEITTRSGGSWGGYGDTWEAELCMSCAHQIKALINSKRNERGLEKIEVREFDW